MKKQAFDSKNEVMNILVTGGAGYIGSHTCKKLKESGFTPVTYDNLSRGFKSAVQWGPFVEGDLEDQEKLIKTLREYQIQGVLHFAAFAYVGESVTQPSLYYQNNVVGSLSLLQAMQKVQVKHLVFSSTCATYGEPVETPMTEEHPQVPINPYGQSKLIVEKIILDFVKAYSLNAVILRYFNAAGSDPSLSIGENHEPETHLIPLAIEAALNPQNPLSVFGNDYPTPDGTCIRDYIHVDDLAEAHVLGLKKMLERDWSGVFNLGTGKGYSVSEIVNAVEAISGKTVAVKMSPRRVGDPPMLVSGCEKAFQVLGWKPRYYDIKKIIKTAYDWRISKENSHG